MKKYLFNLAKNGHNLELAKNVAFNNEDWKAFEQIQNIICELLANRVSYNYAEVTWNIWQKANEISIGACEYRNRCNERSN